MLGGKSSKSFFFFEREKKNWYARRRPFSFRVFDGFRLAVLRKMDGLPVIQNKLDRISAAPN